MSYIYGALATGCGYVPEVIAGMTLFDVRRIFSYWENHPPVHLILAARYGIEPKSKRKTLSASGSGISVDDLKARYSNGVIA